MLGDGVDVATISVGRGVAVATVGDGASVAVGAGGVADGAGVMDGSMDTGVGVDGGTVGVGVRVVDGTRGEGTIVAGGSVAVDGGTLLVSVAWAIRVGDGAGVEVIDGEGKAFPADSVGDSSDMLPTRGSDVGTTSGGATNLATIQTLPRLRRPSASTTPAISIPIRTGRPSLPCTMSSPFE